MIELLRAKLNDDDDVGNRLAHITRTYTDTQSSVENNTIQARKKNRRRIQEVHKEYRRMVQERRQKQDGTERMKTEWCG